MADVFSASPFKDEREAARLYKLAADQGGGPPPHLPEREILVD